MPGRITCKPKRNLIFKLMKHVWAIANTKPVQSEIRILINKRSNKPPVLHRHKLQCNLKCTAIIEHKSLSLIWVSGDLSYLRHFAAKPGNAAIAVGFDAGPGTLFAIPRLT